jgi:hypothetical protein
MRTLPAGLGAHLASGTTTLCHCWKLMPLSGPALGFTDHDRDLVFDGVTFEAQAGFEASEIESSLGLSIHTSTIKLVWTTCERLLNCG